MYVNEISYFHSLTWGQELPPSVGHKLSSGGRFFRGPPIQNIFSLDGGGPGPHLCKYGKVGRNRLTLIIKTSVDNQQ